MMMMTMIRLEIIVSTKMLQRDNKWIYDMYKPMTSLNYDVTESVTSRDKALVSRDQYLASVHRM